MKNSPKRLLYYRTVGVIDGYIPPYTKPSMREINFRNILTQSHNEEVIQPYPHYYVYDYLGNTRIVYGAHYDCETEILDKTLFYVGDYYPYGENLRTYEGDELREPFNTTYHERDESLLDYRKARYSDSKLGRFLRVDPMADQRPWVSPYNYVQNNPITRVDITGQLDQLGVGVNESGAIVYDDEKNDGNIYYFGDYQGPLLSSMEQVSQKGLSFDTWAKGGNWVGSSSDFDQFIKGQLSYIDETGKLNTNSFRAYFGKHKLQESHAIATTISDEKIMVKNSGKVIRDRNNIRLHLNPAAVKSKGLFYNIHDLRFSLSNELYHLTLPNPQIFKSRSAINNYYKNNVEEIRSSEFQLNHWTRWNASDPAVHRAKNVLKSLKN